MTIRKKGLIIFVLSVMMTVFALVIFSACNKNNSVKAQNIILSDNKLTIYNNEQPDIVVTVFPQDAINKNYIIETSDTNVLTVNGKNITVAGVGTATLKYSISNDASIFAECEVTVLPYISLTAITPLDDEIIINFKSPAPELVVEFSPANATNKKLAVKFSDDTIARYEGGKFYGLRPGMAIAEITGENDVCAEVSITVEEYNFSVIESDLFPVNGYYYNYFGHRVLGPYDTVKPFENGLAVVGILGIGQFVINTNGEIVSPIYKNDIYLKLGKYIEIQIDGEWKLFTLEGELLFRNLINISTFGDDNEYIFVQTNAKTTIFTSELEEIIGLTDSFYVSSYSNKPYLILKNSEKNILIDMEMLKTFEYIGMSINLFKITPEYLRVRGWRTSGTYTDDIFISLLNDDYYGNCRFIAESPDGVYVIFENKMLLLDKSTHTTIQTYEAPPDEYWPLIYNPSAGEGYLILESNSSTADPFLIYTTLSSVIRTAARADGNFYSYIGGSYATYNTENGVFITTYPDYASEGQLLFDEVLPVGTKYHRYLGGVMILKCDDGSYMAYDTINCELFSDTKYMQFSNNLFCVAFDRFENIGRDFYVLNGNNVEIYKTQKIENQGLFSDGESIFLWTGTYYTLYVYEGTFIEASGYDYFIFKDNKGKLYLASTRVPGVTVTGFTNYKGDSFMVDGKEHFSVIRDGRIELIEGQLKIKLNDVYQYTLNGGIYFLNLNTLQSTRVADIPVFDSDAVQTFTGYEYLYEQKSDGTRWIYSLDKSQSLKLESQNGFSGQAAFGNVVSYIGDIVFGMFTNDDDSKRLAYYKIEAACNYNLSQFMVAGDGVIVYTQSALFLNERAQTLKVYLLPSGAEELEKFDYRGFYYTILGQRYAVFECMDTFIILHETYVNALNYISEESYEYARLTFDDMSNIIIGKSGDIIAQGNFSNNITKSFSFYNDLTNTTYKAYLFTDDSNGLMTLYYSAYGIVVNGIQEFTVAEGGVYIVKINGVNKFYALDKNGFYLFVDRAGAKAIRTYSVTSGVRKKWYEFDDGFMIRENGVNYHVRDIQMTENLSLRYIVSEGGRIAIEHGEKVYIFFSEDSYTVYIGGLKIVGSSDSISSFSADDIFYISYQNGNIYMETFFTGEFDLIVEISHNQYILKAKHGNILVIYLYWEDKTYFYDICGELLETASGNWQSWWVLPVEYTASENGLHLLYPDETISIANIAPLYYNSNTDQIRMLIQYNEKSGVGIFTDKQGRLIIFDFNQRIEIYRSAAKVF